MTGFTFHLIPHTHWDREWYLPESVLLPRLVSAVDDLLARLHSDPDTKFLLDGQTVLVEDYLRVRPERESELSELVRSGRLQVGPWYVLADELIPSGESLIRNLLAGQADARRLGGRAEVLYSPDAFGHPAEWPTLASEFGIRFGVIWRGLGGETGQETGSVSLARSGWARGAGLPSSSRWLRGRIGAAGGCRATATRMEPRSCRAGLAGGHPARGGVRGRRPPRRPSGAGPSAIAPRTDRVQPASSGSPGSRISSRRLRRKLTALPVLCGELRWSYGYTWTLQGVHGTRAPLKRRHSLVELALGRMAEPLAALAQATRGGDRRPLLHHAWRTLLQSEFHDSIAGTTSDAVARRVELRLDDARNLASEIARASLDELAGNIPDRARAKPESAAPRMVLWNPVPRRRRTIADCGSELVSTRRARGPAG